MVYPSRWNIEKAHLVVSLRETCAPTGKVKGNSMASYHCTVKVGGKGKAASHSAYISREGKYSGRERYEDLESTAYGNMPKWAAHNPAHFWNAADEHERANGATYREIEVALPRELDPPSGGRWWRISSRRKLVISTLISGRFIRRMPRWRRANSPTRTSCTASARGTA